MGEVFASAACDKSGSLIVSSAGSIEVSQVLTRTASALAMARRTRDGRCGGAVAGRGSHVGCCGGVGGGGGGGGGVLEQARWVAV